MRLPRSRIDAARDARARDERGDRCADVESKLAAYENEAQALGTEPAATRTR